MSNLRAAFSLYSSKLQPIRQFLAAQGVTVAGNLLYGLLCVRLLATADYAKFVVLFGVQGSLVILMDVGISGSLIPLIGQRVDDHQLIADYLATLRQLSQRLYLVLAAGLLVVYPLLVKNRGWSLPTIVAMIAILLVSTWFMRIGAAYGAVLILLRDRAVWYRGQMISSLGTLALLGLFSALHLFTAFAAILINVAGIVFVGLFYLARARRLLVATGHPAPEKRRAILRLALPNIPGIIFYALQGQVALFLITIFGHTTAVASIGALSRLGQIFALFTQMNPLLVEPYFAKLAKARLLHTYLSVLALTGVLCAAVTAAACWFPQLFLWILGPKYSGLHYEVMLVIASSSISYFTNVLWVIHSARRFIYWWNNILNIVLTIVVQLVFILRADLTTVRSVVLLNLATVVTALVTNLLSGAFGFTRGPRDVEDPVLEILPEMEATEPH
jgi:O-antigen/teichoic acid export membrane protein